MGKFYIFWWVLLTARDRSTGVGSPPLPPTPHTFDRRSLCSPLPLFAERFVHTHTHTHRQRHTHTLTHAHTHSLARARARALDRSFPSFPQKILTVRHCVSPPPPLSRSVLNSSSLALQSHGGPADEGVGLYARAPGRGQVQDTRHERGVGEGEHTCIHRAHTHTQSTHTYTEHTHIHTHTHTHTQMITCTFHANTHTHTHAHTHTHTHTHTPCM